MPNAKHILKFAGKPVVDYEVGMKKITPGSKVYRVRNENRWGEVSNTFLINFRSFLAQPKVADVSALVVGGWDGATDGIDSANAVEQLVGARDRLPKLKSLFFGDITYREYEISWLRQSDVSPIFLAYPNLEEAVFRGGVGLRFGNLSHQRLLKLTIQAGGMPPTLVREILSADLPSLTHLELWLGAREYGGGASLKDLGPLLAGECFPKMRSLGLRNREVIGRIVVDIANSPVVKKLDALDLSMSDLNDQEVAPLLDVAGLRKLKTLDLSQNFISEAMLKEFKRAKIKVKSDGQRVADIYDNEEYRYIVIGE